MSSTVEKFGNSTTDGTAAEVIMAVTAAPNLRFVGLSHHVGFAGVAGDYTRERELMHHRLCAREVATFASGLPVACERLDLGGGFRSGDKVFLATPGVGCDDAGLYELPSIDEYADAIVDELSVAYPDSESRPTLQFETGGYQVANAALLLTRVIEVKPNHNIPPRCIVGVDAAMTMFSSKGATRMASEVRVVGRDWKGGSLADVVGQSCNYDSLVEGVLLPTLAPDDILILLTQGAYSDVTGNQMNALSRPAAVMVDQGRATLIKRREELEDVTQRNIVPAYLWG